LYKQNFQNKDFINDAIEVLKNVTSILEEANIQYYLDFGTLLGAIRDNSFIPWDNDLDITILNEKDFIKIPEILNIINKQFGYSVKTITYKESNLSRKNKNKKVYYKELGFTDENNFQIAKVKKKKLFGLYKVRLDIFFKYKKDGFLNFVADGKKYKVEEKYLKDGLTTITFYNHNFYIPKQYKEYLTAVYGEWQKPDDSWSKEECITLVREDKQ